MPHRRPTCPIGDRHAPSETDMPHRRPICPIGDRYACGDPWETNMPAKSDKNVNTYLVKYINFFFTFCLLICIYWKNVRTPIRHACWSLIRNVGLRSNMPVSDGSLISHVGLRWISYRSTMGLRSGMLVSDGSPRGLR